MNTKLENVPRALATCLLALSCIRADADAGAQNQSATNVSTSSDYVCVQRGPNSRIWQRAVLETNQSGIVRTNLHSYTELATGLCYLENGEYVDSVEQINLAGNGAEAAQGPCQVQWASDASTAGGAVQLTSPDGQQFKSRVFGLALRDTSTGSNVLIAQITNSTGTLVGQNQIVYPAAFSGLQADIQDIYRKSGFEQNVVLREQPPSPADYGLNPETTWLEVLTEFFNPPVPTKTTVQTDGESDDVKLDFGDLHIGRGTAFLTPEQTNLSRLKVNVSKRWETLDDGRVFLIEEVPYQAMTNLLQTLPPHASTGKPGAKIRRTASLKSLLQAGNAIPKLESLATLAALHQTGETARRWNSVGGTPTDATGSASALLRRDKTVALPKKLTIWDARSSGAIKVAQAMPRRPGVVIDYTTVSGAETSYDFQGDTTYYLSGGFEIDSPGPVIFEGGTVIKIPGSGSGIDNVSGVACIFNGSSYRPVVFTSSDDNSVGESIGSGSPSVGGGTYVDEDSGCFGDPVTVANARFSYAGCVYDDGSGTAGRYFKDCQFVNCSQVMYIGEPDFVTLENILCANCATFMELGGAPVNAENITVDSCSAFASGVYGSGITNSILTGCDSSITDFNLDHTTTNSSSNNIFQTVGAGSYYLVDGSTNRNAGTTNIDPELLADLRTKTTYPPVTNDVFTFTNDYTFFPQAQRDTGTPDLGYHYDPIDYAVGYEVSGATMTVLPGTALAMMGEFFGIWANDGASLQFQGTATQPINIFRYNTVQEMSNPNWSTGFPWEGYLYNYSGGYSAANFRFVNWSALANDNFFDMDTSAPTNALSLFGCQFYNAPFYISGPDVLATNCLFQRVAMTLNDSYYFTNHHTFYNNLFEYGSLTNYYDIAGGHWTFCDNLFDQTAISQDNPVDVASNNAFVTGCDRLLPTNAYDVVLTSSPAYQPAWMGAYYYPTNQTNLIHQGSRSASAAGLYHYTVTTNNVMESNSIVSIGYHYVATDTNGAPFDTSGDGIPDYIADTNGNGTGSWTNYISPNELTGANGLMVFTPLQ